MRSLLLAVLLALLASAAHAQKWSNFATISPTASLVTNTLCYSDGRDLACDGAGGLLVTSGTVAFSNVSTTNISVSTINGQAAGNFGGLGDRITSGTLAAVANSATGYISLTTVSTTWGYLSSGASFIPNLHTNTLSATTAIQVGSNSLTCASGISGTMRYSQISSTMEYCNGTVWTSMGPSATLVPFFRVTSTNSPAVGGGTKIVWNTIQNDTNNNFSTSTGLFTATIPGTYLFTANALIYNGSSQTDSELYIFKNNTSYGCDVSNGATGTYGHGVSCILNMAAGDTASVVAWTNGSGAYIYTTHNQFSGALITMGGSGGGGTATPAGGSNDVQFNSGGSLGADTGKFTYNSGQLSAPAVSTTSVTASGAVSAATVTVSQNSTACSTATMGTFRRNPTTNRMEICQ
jgi:hypothetical protein